MRLPFRQKNPNLVCPIRRTRPNWRRSVAFLLTMLATLLLGAPVVWSDDQHANEVRIGVLMYCEHRQPSLDGFKKGMMAHGKFKGMVYHYDIRNTSHDRSKLLPLAEEIISTRPDIAIATGAIEADALKIASQGSGVPVVFLAGSNAVERGLAESVIRPGGNVTGIETNDAALTEKRLWYITKLLPKARQVTCLNYPTISSSKDAAEIARRVAPTLGLELRVIDVSSLEEAKSAAASISQDNTDVILLLPGIPLDQIEREVLRPISLAHKIPILGYHYGSILNGAFAAFGASRYAAGAQGARLTVKVLHGADPANTPLESPEQLDLTINRWMVNQLDLRLPSRVWRLASKLVDIKF